MLCRLIWRIDIISVFEISKRASKQRRLSVARHHVQLHLDKLPNLAVLYSGIGSLTARRGKSAVLGAAKLLSKVKARRIEANIAKLPELLRKP